MARAMKDSGIASIGFIPEDWEVSCFKYNYSFGKGLPITKADLVETGLGVISYGQIHSKKNHGVDVTNDLIRFVDRSYKVHYPQCQLHQYDFVFADTSEDLDGCGNCVYIRNEIELFAGYHSLVVRPIARRDNRYMAYLFLTDEWRQQLRNSVSGIKVFSITKGIMEKTRILIPSLTEQKRIADYLDIICDEIYDSMADIQAQIETLEQYKRSVITEAVTKGLNPNVPLKAVDSVWITEIPATWQFMKAGYLFVERSVRAKGDETPLSLSQKDGLVITDEMTEHAMKSKTYDGWKKVWVNDLVLNRFKAHLGVFFCSKYNGMVSFHYGVYVPISKLNVKFYEYLFHSKPYCEMFADLSNGITVGLQNLGNANFYSAKCVYPSPAEQDRIVEYLDAKCAEIDAIIDGKRQQLATLEEYKKSIIFEYVTGKKEVPTNA